MIFPSTIVVVPRSQHLNEEIEKIANQIDQKVTPNNPDIFVINQETGWGIDVVRQINRFLSTKPFCHPTKLVIIFDSQNLQIEAQNALLKFLEEPGKNHYFILTTDNPQQLLPTILSRCHLIYHQTKKPQAKDHFRLSNKLEKNLLTSENLSANKLELPQILEEQLCYYHQQFLKNPDSKSLNLIEKLIKTSQMVKSNVDPKSALDYFFLTVNIN